MRQFTSPKPRIDQAWRNDVFSRARFHLLWNIIPVTLMLLIIGWLSLRTADLIDGSKPEQSKVVALLQQEVTR